MFGWLWDAAFGSRAPAEQAPRPPSDVEAQDDDGPTPDPTREVARPPSDVEAQDDDGPTPDTPMQRVPSRRCSAGEAAALGTGVAIVVGSVGLMGLLLAYTF